MSFIALYTFSLYFTLEIFPPCKPDSTREQLEDRDHYARPLSAELIDSVLHAVFVPSADVCALIEHYTSIENAARAAEAQAAQAASALNGEDGSSSSSSSSSGAAPGNDEDEDDEGDEENADAAEAADASTPAAKRKRLQKLSAAAAASSSSADALADDDVPVVKAGAHKKGSHLFAKSSSSSSSSDAIAAAPRAPPPSISSVVDGLASSELHGVLTYSAHLFESAQLERFLKAFLAPTATHPLSAAQLLLIDSAQVLCGMIWWN